MRNFRSRVAEKKVNINIGNQNNQPSNKERSASARLNPSRISSPNAKDKSNGSHERQQNIYRPFVDRKPFRLDQWDIKFDGKRDGHISVEEFMFRVVLQRWPSQMQNDSGKSMVILASSGQYGPIVLNPLPKSVRGFQSKLELKKNY